MSPDLKDLFDDAGRTPAATRGWDADDVVRRGARTRNRRRMLTGAATLGVAAVVVGGSIALVSPGLRGTTVEPGGTTSPSPTSSPSSQVSGSAPAPERTTPAPGPGPCQIRNLTLTLGTGDGAAGTMYFPVVITADPSNCWLGGGVPDVFAVPAPAGGLDDRAPIGPAAPIPQTDPSGSVLMQQDSTASFLVGIADAANYDPAVCLPIEAEALRVGFGSQSLDVSLPAGTMVCSGNVSAVGPQLTVGAIVPGNSGQ